MKNTNEDWRELIQYRFLFEKGNIDLVEYVSTVFRAINGSDTAAETSDIFMDNIGHVLTPNILQEIGAKEIKKLFNKGFSIDIKTFFHKYGNVPHEYCKNFRISENQYAIFQKFLSFSSVETLVSFDKKWYMLTLKRNKNQE